MNTANASTLASRFFSLFQKKSSCDVPAPSLKFPKGTEITCPKCHKLIATSKRDISFGSVMASSDWEGESVVKNSTMACPDDGTRYFRQSPYGVSIHTGKGWVG